MYHIKLGVLLLSVLFVLGCSGGGANNPIVDGTLNSSGGAQVNESLPVIGLTADQGTFNGISLMGAYNLVINTIDMTVDLTPMRIGSIGESYIVSGLGFFTVTPCADCLKFSGFRLDSGNIVLTFRIKHPFQPGDPSQPPTAKNRLDLDVFDLAMVVVPTSETATHYPLTNADTYPGVVANADGFTRELASVISKQQAMPYVLVVDESESPLPAIGYNKFPMGADKTFEVAFSITPGGTISFEMYLTMGYGSSAKRAQRLTPKYYNPEFNRKAAWRVTAEAMGFWTAGDTTTKVDIEVEVYDWQIGASVDPLLADITDVYAASEVKTVSAEVIGMNSTLQSVLGTASTGGTGTPSDPLIYEVGLANENSLPVGTYQGLVKVTDARAVKDPPPAGDRDFLIDSPDGITLNNYKMPEYATYQPFEATIISPPDWHSGGSWNLPAGPCTLDFGIIASTGHAYVASTDLAMQCTQIWKYPGWANPPVFYASVNNLDPLIPQFQPWPLVRIDAALDGALGWTNINTNPWIMAPNMIWNTSTYCNFDKLKNFITIPEANDHRHYMVDPLSHMALFAVDCCDTSEGYQCALYVESGVQAVGFQGIPGSPQGFDYTDADIKWEAFFPMGFIGVAPGQVDPADVAAIDCRVEGNMIIVYILLKANMRVEVFTIMDVGPGPVDIVTPLFHFNTVELMGPISTPVDCELLPPHPNFLPAPNTPLLCVLIDNTAFPMPPPGVGGTVVIYNAMNGAAVDQIGDPVVPAVPNPPKFLDTNENTFSVHVMQLGPKISVLDYF